MMDQYGTKDFITRHTKITTFIPNDNFISELQPLTRMIKLLVQPSLKTESFFSNGTIKL